MKTPPASSHGNNSQESIQDYLDTLLMQATEQPQAQLELPPLSQPDQPEVAPEQPLQRRVAAPSAQPQATVEAPVRRTESAPQPAAQPSPAAAAKAKPYAEPARPLRLNVPLPKVAPAPEPVAEPAPVKAEPVVPAKPEPATAVRQSEAVSAQPASAKVVEQPAEARPAWSKERFECLLFSVGGLTLAVPLVELGTIFPMDGELTPLFGQADWFMGLLPVKEANIRTVNTAKLVMTERYQAEMEKNFNYVISINDVDWGLAVDNVSTAITLQPEEVRWSSRRGKRPWLAGTVVEHMCALLDIGQMSKMFLQQDKNAGQ